METREDRTLLRVLADVVGEVSISVKNGSPHIARYDLVLPTEPLTVEELVDLMRDMRWGDVMVEPEGGKYRVVEATKWERLEE